MSKHRFRISTDVRFTTVGNEVILMDPKAGVYRGLDEVGSAIWKLVDEGCNVEEIVSRLTSEYEITKGSAAEDTQKFLSSLLNLGLIVACEET